MTGGGEEPTEEVSLKEESEACHGVSSIYQLISDGIYPAAAPSTQAKLSRRAIGG